jgi:hypothetical protein
VGAFRDEDRSAQAGEDLLLAVLLPFGSLAIGGLAFIAALFGWLGLLGVVGGAVLFLWLAIGTTSRALRGGAVVALVATLGWSGLVVPASIAAIQHDVAMSRVEKAICSAAPPPGGSVIKCEGMGVSNPFSGNQCGYQVNVWLQTRLPIEALRRFYARRSLLPASVPALQVVQPYVEYEEPGKARVEFLAISEEGWDLRCL